MSKRKLLTVILVAFVTTLMLACAIIFTACGNHETPDDGQNTEQGGGNPQSETSPVAGEFVNDSGYYLNSDAYVIKHTIEFFTDGTAEMYVTLLSVSTGVTASQNFRGFYVWQNGNYIDLMWSGAENPVTYAYTGLTINTGSAVLTCTGKNSRDEFAGMYNMVSYGTSGPGKIEGEAIQYLRDGESTTSVTAAPSVGAEFVRWSDGVMTASRSDDDVKDNMSVYAEFRQVTPVFALSYSAGRGGSLTGETYQVVLSGESGTAVTAVPDSGYAFLGWSDGVATATRTDRAVENMSVTAEFGSSYTITYAAGEGGSIQGETEQEVVRGTSGTPVTAVPAEGWYFDRWSDGVSTATRQDDPADLYTWDIQAVFKQYHTIKYIVYDEGGTITGETTQYIKQDARPVAVTAVPDSGYELKGWYRDNVSGTPSYSGVNFSAGLDWMYHGGETTTYYAVFQPIAYRCLYYADTGGTVNGSSTRYDVYVSLLTDYATEEILAVPEQGYVFSGWSDGRNDNPRIDVLDPDDPQGVEVVAYFSRGYSLTYTAGEGGSIQGETEQEVVRGTSGTPVTAVPAEGWYFDRWSDGVTTATRTDEDVASNISVTAEFEIDPDYTPFAGGDGSVENPYMIDSLSRLRIMSLYPSAHFVLTADIVLPEVSAGNNNFTPLFSDEKPFLGTLDGAGHKITNLTVYNTETFYSGLFSVIGSTGSVKNLTLDNASVSGTNYVGIVAGWSLGSITDCTVSGTVTHIAANGYKVFVGGIAGRAEENVDGCSAAVDLTVTEAQVEVYVGGIVGYLSSSDSSSSPLTLTASGTISVSSVHAVYVGGLMGHASSSAYLSKCHTEMQIAASGGSFNEVKVGGLMGQGSGIITDSYATGNVSASSSTTSYAGGLIGYSDGSTTITDSYATGNVSCKESSSDSYAGGLIGRINSSTTITDSYATGNVSCKEGSYDSYAGGLIGRINSSTTITDSYATGNVSASSSWTSYAGGLIGYGNYSTTITDSYATGDVTASGSDSHAGGLVGDASSITVRNAYSSSAVSAEGGETVYAGGLAGYVDNSVNLENAHWLKSADTDAVYAVGYSDSLGVPTSIGSTSHAVLDEFYALADTLNAGREVPVWEHTGENTLPSLINGDDESAE